MFWIVGARLVADGFDKLAGHRGVARLVASQLEHSPWRGFTAYDLIFPLFVFVVGASLVLSLPRIIARAGKRAAYARIARRFVVLFALGLVYNGGLSQPWPEVRLMGVLQRIALCYLVTAVLLCHLRWRGLLLTFVAIEVGYWALMSLVAPPGQSVASLAPGRNLANYLDARFLPGAKYAGSWDPEGLLSTIPAIGTCLLGVGAALVVTSKGIPAMRKVVWLVGGGAAMTVLGYVWGAWFPVIKNLWTSSFVLVAGGFSAVLLGGFYYALDVKRVRRWAQPFVWIGANALPIFFLPNLLSLPSLARRIVGGSVEQALGAYGELVVAVVALGLVIALARYLYQRRIFLRV